MCAAAPGNYFSNDLYRRAYWPVFLSMKDDSQSRGYSNLCFIRVNLWLVLFCNES